jgi:hypothetical protein
MASGEPYPFPVPVHPACDSGLIAPQSLREGDWAYGVTACGFVVRAPWEPYIRGQSDELQRAMDAHTRTEHPERWKQIQINRAMSAD